MSVRELKEIIAGMEVEDAVEVQNIAQRERVRRNMQRLGYQIQTKLLDNGGYKIWRIG